MTLWKTVENELAAIKGVLAAVPPNIGEAQQLLDALAQRVKNRKTPASRAFSVDELKKAVEHLSFEMQHFRCYNKLYTNGDLSRFSGAARLAVRYALLLHLRLLVDFFYMGAEQDDCHVDHFNVLDGFEADFPASIHLHSARSKKLSVDLNKLLAHFTTTRWEMRQELIQVNAQFLASCAMKVNAGGKISFKAVKNIEVIHMAIVLFCSHVEEINKQT